MYVCGMTVYDYLHMGHARMLVSFDVISRWIRRLGYDLTYVRNITDIDDKIIKRANDRGVSYEQLTSEMIDAMHHDERQLNIARPDIEPRATDYISGMIEMISSLIEKDFAYLSQNGDVYFRVNRYKSYGKLSGIKTDELYSGVRIKVDSNKEDNLDFVLWKAAKQGEPFWSSPWGDGRPGWHIECSVMSSSCLGHTLDIHGGGPDLVFPHHENEIAQSECAHEKCYVRNWLHCGSLRVDGEKMSKSLGNFFTVRDLLETNHPEVLRYFLISSHYRSPINYSESSLKEAAGAVRRVYVALKGFDVCIRDDALSEFGSYKDRFLASMNDDFNTPGALAVIFDMVKDINQLKNTDFSKAERLSYFLRFIASDLGVFQLDSDAIFENVSLGVGVTKEDVELLIAERNAARRNKDWPKSDQIRKNLLSKGVELEDSKEGTSWKFIL